MKRFALLAALAFSLTACQGLGGAVASAGSAPLAATTADDEALDAAWKSFDVALDAINLLNLTPGTPKARAVAAGIRTVNRGLGAAERFAAAGSETDLLAALAEAKAGLLEIRAALGAAQ